MDLLKGFGSEKGKRSDPSNEKLIKLLNSYSLNKSDGKFRKVYNELWHGNSYLLVPSEPNITNEDKYIQSGTLQFTAVFNLDGLKVLGAFTSEPALLGWAKKPTPYTPLPARDVLELCQQNNIGRIVIDSNQPTMFVLERNIGNVKKEVIQEETEVEVGTPLEPIAEELLKKMQHQFKLVSSILEVYQYVIHRNKESILVLGFRLETYTSNSRTASINAVQNAMLGEKLSLPLEVFMLEDESWYETAKNVRDSLLYQKSDPL